MPMLLLRDLPRYECLLDGARRFPELDPSACEVYLNLLRAGDEAFRCCGEPLEAHGISAGRFTVLMLLMRSRDGGCGLLTPAELAERSGVTRATMTGLVDTLERDGLVRREPDPNDRRTTPVVLTAAGESFLNQVVPAYFRRMGALVAPLDESERRTLVALLAKLVQGAEISESPCSGASAATSASPAPAVPLSSSVP
jgi:DNA-binding MarR family transcriptional regulator